MEFTLRLSPTCRRPRPAGSEPRPPVTYAADYAIRHHRSGGLRFPSTPHPRFVDHVYLAAAVSTTFGTTDVEVTAPRVRRVVIAHSVVAFVFNTVIVSLLVGSLVR